MNPWGILLIGIGLVMMVIGFKGSQHKVIAAFKGTKSSSTATAGAASSNSAASAAPPGVTVL